MILADDMRYDDLSYMPKTRRLRNTYSGRPPADLKARLAGLEACAGASCRSADGGP